MNWQLAVFDLAGTTVNDPEGVSGALRTALAEAGVTVTREAANAVQGIRKPIAIRMLLEQVNAGPELLARVDAIHDRFVELMIEFYKTDPSVFEIPGTSDVFRLLKSKGIAVTVDTGFSRDIGDVVLERMGWQSQGLIQASVTSDEVANGRPYPDMVFHLMKVTGVTDPKRVIKVGDASVDLLEGTAAGCGMVVGVCATGSHTREQLLPHPHTHLIDSIAELPALIQG